MALTIWPGELRADVKRGGAANSAIVCMPWSEHEKSNAERLGCKFIEKPLKFFDLQDCICEIARNTPKNRMLLPLEPLG